MEVLNNIFLTDMEKDVIGEVMNISLGSSATSLSSLLSKRVEITVPKVSVVSAHDFDFKELEPAVGVEIKYIEGISGDNVLVLKKADIKVILETLMGIEISDEEFILDEIAMSAVCEVMNQMMGSAATALADFLGKTVNISTPIAYEIEDKSDFKGRYFAETDYLVEVKFDLKVGDIINSEFINVLSIPLAKEMVNLFLSGASINDTEKLEIVDEKIINKEINVSPELKVASVDTNNNEEPIVQRRNPKPKKQQDYYNDEYEDDESEDDERYRKSIERRPRKNKASVRVSPIQYESFDDDEEEELTEEQRSNLGLIMSVPLQISVEIGRTKRKIKDILEFSQGTIVELDKQAGAQVDIIINGQVIAKGDVVVINDNFGVRVSEIVKKDEIVKITL